MKKEISVQDLVPFARKPLELNVKEGHRDVLIVTDDRTEPEVWQAFSLAAKEMGLEPNVILMPARAMHGNEPTRTVAEAMKNTDLLITANSTALSHTNAVRNALQTGRVTYMSMPGISVDLLTNGGATADYQEVGRITNAIAEILKTSNQVRIISDLGMDVTMRVNGMPIFALAGVYKHGAISCFPDGETAVAPVEGTTNGVIVADIDVHSIGRLEEPIKLTVKDGNVVKVEGGHQARKLEEIWRTQGDAGSFNIAELAFGTNPNSRLTGHTSEIKKKLGTIHIGIGDNHTLGGTVISNTHLDFVINNPTVFVDDKVILDRGKLMI